MRLGVQTAAELPPEVYVAELDLDELLRHAEFQPQFTPLPKYPSVRRDLAIVVIAGQRIGEVLRLLVLIEMLSVSEKIENKNFHSDVPETLSAPSTPLSCAGLTRVSITCAKRWIAELSPAMTAEKNTNAGE